MSDILKEKLKKKNQNLREDAFRLVQEDTFSWLGFYNIPFHVRVVNGFRTADSIFNIIENNLVEPLIQYACSVKETNNNVQKDKLKALVKATLDNVLSIAANNLSFEACIAFNSASSIPEHERDKVKELDTFLKAINGQLQQASKQAMIYIDDLVFEDK